MTNLIHLDGKGPISIAFEPKNHIHVVLGLNDFKDAAMEKHDDKNYFPKDIIIHPR